MAWDGRFKANIPKSDTAVSLIVNLCILIDHKMMFMLNCCTPLKAITFSSVSQLSTFAMPLIETKWQEKNLQPKLESWKIVLCCGMEQ